MNTDAHSPQSPSGTPGLDVERLAADVAPFSRRRFLAGTASMAVGLGLAQTACSPAVETPAGLDAIGSDYAVLDRFARAVLPTDQFPNLHPFAEVPVLQNIDALLATVPEPVRGDLSKGLSLFNYAAIVLGFHLRPFTALDEAAAIAYVRRWQAGNAIQRGLVFALKQIAFVAYWQEPATWKAIGYDGPVTAPYGVPRLGNAPLPAVDVPATKAAAQ